MCQHTRFWYCLLIYAHADKPSKAKGLNYGLSILQPYFVYVNSEGCGVSEHLLLTDAISMGISCTGTDNKPVHDNCIQQRL